MSSHAYELDLELGCLALSITATGLPKALHIVEQDHYPTEALP
jgi:hypothetical protein